MRKTKTGTMLFLSAASLMLPSVSSAQLPFTLDPASIECVGCHEDAISVKEPMRVCHEGGCDHPVGVSYESLVSKNRGLVPAGSLPDGIGLLDGKIGCTTCHIPYTADHETLAASRDEAGPDPMLSVDNTGSGLCVACHRK